MKSIYPHGWGIQTGFALLFSVIFPAMLCAQSFEINRIQAQPDRIIIYCSTLPVLPLQASLSADKQKLHIQFASAAVADAARQIQGKGCVEDIYTQQKGKNAIVSVQLKARKGYTAALLPHSKAVMIDFFSWDALKPAEEAYRNALLGLENNVKVPAIESLKKSAAGGYANAEAMLGLVYYHDNQMQPAREYLARAISRAADIPDMYAAASLIARLQGQKQAAERYAEQYTQITGMQVPALATAASTAATDEILNDSAAISEPPSIADALLHDQNLIPAQDTAAQHADTITAGNTGKTDTSRFASLFRKDTTQQQNKTDKAGLVINSPWMRTSLMALGAFVGTGFLYLVFLYMRWKRRRLKLIREKAAQQPSAFDTALQQEEQKLPGAAPAPAGYAAGAYARAAGTDTSSVPGIINPAQQPIPASLHAPVTAPLAAPDSHTDIYEEEMALMAAREEHQALLTAALESMRSQRPAHTRISRADVLGIQKDEKVITDHRSESGLPASFFAPGEVELALHLQQEQMRHKADTLTTLRAEEVPDNTFTLARVARQLGVEKHSLEVKKSLAHLEENHPVMSELIGKFAGMIHPAAARAK